MEYMKRTIVIRLSDTLLEQIKQYRREQAIIPSRAEVVRAFVEAGLRASITNATVEEAAAAAERSLNGEINHRIKLTETRA